MTSRNSSNSSKDDTYGIDTSDTETKHHFFPGNNKVQPLDVQPYDFSGTTDQQHHNEGKNPSLFHKFIDLRKNISVVVYFVTFFVVLVTISCTVLIALSITTTQMVSKNLVSDQMDVIGSTTLKTIIGMRNKAVFKANQFVEMTTGPMFDENPADGYVNFTDWTLPATMMQQFQDDPMFNSYIFLIDNPDQYHSYTVYFENVSVGFPFLLIQTFQMDRNATVYFLKQGGMLDFETPDMVSSMRSLHEAPAWNEVNSMSVGYKVARPSPTYYNGLLWTAAGLVVKDYTPDGFVRVRMLQFDFAYFTSVAITNNPTKHSTTIITDSFKEVLATSEHRNDLWIPLGGDLVRYKTLKEMGSDTLSDLYWAVDTWNGGIPSHDCGSMARVEDYQGAVIRTRCELKLGGEKHYVDVVSWKENVESSTYYVVTIVPESDILKESKIQMRNLIIISVCIEALSIVIAISLSLGLAIPIRRFSRILRIAASLEDTGYLTSQIKSTIFMPTSESRNLRDATNNIVSCLNIAKSYSNKEVLNEVIQGRLKNEPMGKTCDVTIVFIDVVNYTSYTTRFGSEAMISALRKLFQTIIDIVTVVPEESPTIDKFIGDCIMLFYNQPIHVVDHALVAVKHAIEICDVINACGKILVGYKDDNVKLCVKIGLATGDAFVGNYGSDTRMNYTAIGTPVNLAARFENMAAEHGWQIACSSITYSRTCNFIRYRKMPRIRVKGFQEHIQAYEPICLMNTEKLGLLDMIVEWEDCLNSIEVDETEHPIEILNQYIKTHQTDQVAIRYRDRLVKKNKIY